MGQENKILAILKKVYKKILFSEKINNFLKKVIGSAVSFWANRKEFYFPEKFVWDWKVEMLLQTYERNTVKFFKKNIKKRMTVVDIGAHIGYYTRIFSKLVGPNGKVYAFEPETENYFVLEKNTKKMKNVEIFEKAISNVEGKISFYKIPNNTGCHSVVLPKGESKKMSVEAITLDNFLFQHNIAKIDFIKMDIEGGELLALKGMGKTFSAMPKIGIVSEFNPEALSQNKENEENLLEIFRKKGFTVYEIGKNGNKRPIKGNERISFYSAKEKYTNIFCQK